MVLAPQETIFFLFFIFLIKINKLVAIHRKTMCALSGQLHNLQFSTNKNSVSENIIFFQLVNVACF